MRQIFSVKHPAFTYHLHLTNQSSLKPLKCLCKKPFHFCLIATLIIDNIIECPQKCHPILSPVKARGWFWQPYKLVWLSKYESPRATRAVWGGLGTRELGRCRYLFISSGKCSEHSVCVLWSCATLTITMSIRVPQFGLRYFDEYNIQKLHSHFNNLI